MTRILITGGTGYIGSCLVKYLLSLSSPKSQLEVYCLARFPFNTEYLSEVQAQVHWCAYDGSLQSMKAALESSKPDLVYHLATFFTKAHGDQELPAMLKANIELGCNLIEAMSQYGVRHLVYTTSVTEFAPDGSYHPATVYAAMKRAFLDIARFYINEGLLRVGLLALNDTYGPHDKRPKVMNCLKQAVKQHNEMKFNSTGEQVFDLVYIDDVIDSLYLLGQHMLQGNGEALQCYQVFAEQPLSLKDTVSVFAAVNHLECNVSWKDSGVKHEGNSTLLCQSPTALKRESNTASASQAARIFPRVPGWQARVTLQDGMQRFFKA